MDKEKGIEESSLPEKVDNTTDTDPVYYYRLRKRGKTHEKAAKMAGYSPKTQERYILQNRKVKAVVQSVEEMRLINQKRPGHTYLDNVEVLQEIRDDEDIPPNVRISAIKEHNLMQGHHSPKEIKSSNLHLYAEFEGFEQEELEYMMQQAQEQEQNDDINFNVEEGDFIEEE